MPHRKLLLADDSITIRRVVELMFAGEDVEVLAVTDGEEAIARIPIERPDIVLADIRMPKRTGYDVATFVKERRDLEHIPVLLLAGVFEPVDQVLVQRARVDGVLIKPFEPRHVVARVRELWGRHQDPGEAERLGTATHAVAAGHSDELPAPEPPAPTSPLPESPDGGTAAAAPSPRSRSETLADYFGELAAAIAARERSPATSSGDPLDVDREVPTLDAILARDPTRADDPEAGRLRELHEPAPSGHAGASQPGGGAAGTPPALEPEGVSANLEGSMSHAETADALVEYVTRHVIERLAPDAAHAVVSQVVSEIAERLVREEIAKIRAGGQQPESLAARPESTV